MCLLATNTTFDVTGVSRAHSNVQSTLVELTNVGGHEGGACKELPMAEDTSSNLETQTEVPTEV